MILNGLEIDKIIHNGNDIDAVITRGEEAYVGLASKAKKAGARLYLDVRKDTGSKEE